MNMFFRIMLDYDALTDQIVAGIPEEAFISSGAIFVDPAFAGGQFLRSVARRLRKYGHSIANIRSRLFGFEDNICYLNHPKNKSTKLIAQLSVMSYEDFLNMPMKFDVVVGNPPFQDGARKDEANKLWPQFVKKGVDLLKENGYLAMITPNGWMQPTADIGKGTGKHAVSIFNDLFKKNNLIVANIDSDGIGNAFFKGVGSTFSYFILQSGRYSGQTLFHSAAGIFVADIQEFRSLPKIACKESLSITRKMVGKPFTFQDQNHGLNGKESPVLTDGFLYPIYHTNKDGGTYWYGEKNAAFSNVPKVIISLSGKYLPVFNTSTGFSNMCLAVLCQDIEQAARTHSILNSKLYRFWVEMQKFSGFNPRKLILNLPELPVDRPWTDQEIYEHFELDQEEINYIEANVK